MSETELKYRVGAIPATTGKQKKIYQAYLNLESEEIKSLLREFLPGIKPEEMAEARVRSIAEELDGEDAQCYLITLKGEGGKTREEKEALITLADFEMLKSKAGDGEIEKIRTETEIAPGIVAEFDRYLGKLEGLMIMEIEYNPEAYEEETIKDHLAEWNPGIELEEVTEAKEFKNKRLAKLQNLEELELAMSNPEIDDKTPEEVAREIQTPGIYKIAITGGPCGGKSEVIRHLQETWGNQITLMPEVATQLLEVPLNEGGVGVPGKDVEWSPEWQDEFQSRIIEKQLEDETRLIQLADAEDQRIKIMICDRGIMDGSAYEPKGKEEFLRKYGLRQEVCYSLYDAVIHLNSLAVDNAELYEKLKHTNPSRYEDAETAKALDERIAIAYEGHRNLIKISATGELGDKLRQCEAIISELTGINPEVNSETSSETDLEVDEATTETKSELNKA